MNANAFDIAPSMPPAEMNPAAPTESPVATGVYYTLKRSGKRPLKFDGRLLGMAMSFEIGTPFWFEINIYQNNTGSFVLERKMFTKKEGEKDRFWAETYGSIDEVLDFLERHDAAHDVPVRAPFVTEGMSLADLYEQSLKARMTAEEARRQFQSLVGEMLYELTN